MSGLFKQAFNSHLKQNNKAEQPIPKAVIKELNKELPNQFHYQWDKKLKQLVITPNKASGKTSFDVQFDAKKNGLPTNLTDQELIDYVYRTQKTIELSHVYIKDKEGNKREVTEDPFSHKNSGEQIKFFASPKKFPPAIPLTFKVEDGDDITVLMKRKPYESMDHILLENENISGLSIRWIISEEGIKKTHEDNQTTEQAEKAEQTDKVEQQQKGSIPAATMTVTSKPTSADSVDDAIKGLKILHGFATGNLLIDGHEYGGFLDDKSSLDIKDIEEKLDIWKTFKALEEKLNIKFDPKADYPIEDAKAAFELDQSLLQNKEQVTVAPFSHFHLGTMKFRPNEKEEFIKKHSEVREAIDKAQKEGKELTDNELIVMEYKHMIGHPNTTFTFLQDVGRTLLGAEFSVVRSVILQNIVIDKIVPDSKGMEVYIRNCKENKDSTLGEDHEPWKMITKYALNESEAQTDLDRLFSKYCDKKKQ